MDTDDSTSRTNTSPPAGSTDYAAIQRNGQRLSWNCACIVNVKLAAGHVALQIPAGRVAINGMRDDPQAP
jgi:hypothetical protein